ncbi:hypothetical protein BD779DRAFT_319048 [Infundibulicybe gibba]|nr:hypothetical protein BD779DRAFT_319048 [Infundibulicybe gibba]
MESVMVVARPSPSSSERYLDDNPTQAGDSGSIEGFQESIVTEPHEERTELPPVKHKISNPDSESNLDHGSIKVDRDEDSGPIEGKRSQEFTRERAESPPIKRNVSDSSVYHTTDPPPRSSPSNQAKSRWSRMGPIVRRRSITSFPRPVTPSVAPSEQDLDASSIKAAMVTVRPATPPAGSERDSDEGSIGADHKGDSRSIEGMHPQESIVSKENTKSPSIKHKISDSNLHPTDLSPDPPPPQKRNALLEGWRGCVLPDRNIYYVHSARQAITDVDMHDQGLLDAIMTHLESRNYGMLVPRQQELWLQNMGSRERGFIPLGCLVDHQKRSATFDALPEATEDGGDDRLDAECRYWSFMQAHPAHAPLPPEAQAEALAVLTWNLTDQLLSSRRSAPAPFTQEECRELATLIRSFDKDGEDEPTPLRTHIISKILLRVVRWRQLHPRPDQPLPVDADLGEPERVSIGTRRPASPEVIPIDHGMLPSRAVFMERRISRRRMAPSQRLEQGKVDSGDGRAQVNQLFPSLFDSRPNNSNQQNAGETPNEVLSIVHGFELPANPPRSMASSTKPLHVQDSRPFHAHGWAECVLPDGSIYYVHHTYQVVTDVDLSSEKLLDAMMAYLEEHDDVIPPGQELWLRDAGSHGGEFVPLRWLVDHSKRCRDDRLDANYQYWSFMETHPVHTSLPSDAHQDAMDALHWASTNELLPSHHSKTMPFTREECQSLTALLQSIGMPCPPQQMEVI